MKQGNCQSEGIVHSKLSAKMVLLGLFNVGCCFLLGKFLYHGFPGSYAGKVGENWWLDFFLPLLFVGVVGLACLVMLFYVLICCCDLLSKSYL